MTSLHRTLVAVVAATPLVGCLAPAETESIAVAVAALEPWQSPIPWPTTPPPLAQPSRAPEPEPEAEEPARPQLPSRPVTLPLTAGAALFAQLGACRQNTAGLSAGLANARAMTCLAEVLRGAASF